MDHAFAAALAADFKGPLLCPDDPGYHQARRVWNGTVDKYPGLIARCLGVDVTSFEYRLHPVGPEILAGPLV